MSRIGRGLAWTSIFGALLLGGFGALTAQQRSGEAYVPKQSDRPEPIAGDEAGFRPIFDGETRLGIAALLSQR